MIGVASVMRCTGAVKGAVAQVQADVHTIHMEGVLSEEFFTVRQVLYDSYVWV